MTDREFSWWWWAKAYAETAPMPIYHDAEGNAGFFHEVHA